MLKKYLFTNITVLLTLVLIGIFWMTKILLALVWAIILFFIAVAVWMVEWSINEKRIE